MIEDADTFAGNATKKAVELARWISENSKFEIQNSKLDFVLADDSGLEVDALERRARRPFRALRRAGHGKSENSPDADNNAKLLRLLKDVPAEKRTARFRCVIALVPVPRGKIESASPVCFADELELQTQFSTARAKGKSFSSRADKTVLATIRCLCRTDLTQTFAELGEDVKNKLSHRAKALEKLKIYFNKLPS